MTDQAPAKHAPECNLQTTGRYTEGCAGCLAAARAFGTADAVTNLQPYGVTEEEAYIWWITGLQETKTAAVAAQLEAVQWQLWGVTEEEGEMRQRRIHVWEDDPGDFADFEMRPPAQTNWQPWQLSPDSDPEERWILVNADNDGEEHPAQQKFATSEAAAAFVTAGKP